MIRSILAIVVGLVTFTVFVIVMEVIGSILYPLPAGVDPMNPEVMKAHINSLPRFAILLVLFGWFLGTLCGTGLAVRIARRAPFVPALILLVVFMSANLLIQFFYQHPVWFALASCFTFPLGATAGAFLGRLTLKPLAA